MILHDHSDPFVEASFSLYFRTRTSIQSEPAFDWLGISLDRIGHFKDSMALRCVAFSPARDEVIFGSNGKSLRLCSNLGASSSGK